MMNQNNQQPINNQQVNPAIQGFQQSMYNNNMNTNNGQNMNGKLNSNYVQQAVNPDMNKWAILSIDVPIDWSKSDDKDVPVDFDSIKVLIERASDEY